ncbi:rhomboid family protein [Aphelenchoides avenae]|nr:rhomboid family protein [Aphelenchus avenae]
MAAAWFKSGGCGEDERAHGKVAAAAGVDIIREGSIADIVMVVLIGLLLLGICISLVLHCYFELGKGAKEPVKSTEPDRPDPNIFTRTINRTINHYKKSTKYLKKPQTDAERGRVQDKINKLERNATVGDQWYKLFDRADTEKTGRIPVSRFAKFVQENSTQLGLKPAEIEHVVKDADKDGDGYVSFSELAEIMLAVRHRRARGLTMKTVREMLPRRQQTVAARETLDYSFCPPPTFLIALAIVEIGLYFYQVDLCGPDNTCVFDKLFAVDPAHPFQIWRYLTFMLVHWSTSHLVGNVFGQFVFGTTLELCHRWRIVAVFLLGSISSGLFSLTVSSSATQYLGGASGGVFALIAAHVANVALNWKEMHHPYMHLFFAFAYIAYNAITTGLGGGGATTSLSGHAGGFIGGILLGLIFLRNVVQEKWEVQVQRTALILYVVFVSFCMVAITVRSFGPQLFGEAH